LTFPGAEEDLKMLDRIARIVVLGGIAYFGSRGLLAQYAVQTALFCLAFGVVGEIVYTVCSAPGGCPIGELAKKYGWINDTAIRNVLVHQKNEGGLFGEIAVSRKYITRSQLDRLLVAR